jgi:hypothetical protein
VNPLLKINNSHLILINALGWVVRELKTQKHPSAPKTGNLASHAANWEKITGDPWVLQQIKGYTPQLIATPTQEKAPSEPHLPVEQQEALYQSIMELQQKGAILVTPVQGFLSRMFLIPKKGGGMRPIIDLRELNKFMKKEHFKMEGIHLVKDLMREGDWLVKLDLKDKYFAIPIDEDYQHLLQF